MHHAGNPEEDSKKIAQLLQPLRPHQQLKALQQPFCGFCFHTGNPEEDSKKIAQLLKHGAHCLADLGAAAEQSDAFAAEGIDAILQARLVLFRCKK